jgi:predicted AAA+ superfamily ATPase
MCQIARIARVISGDTLAVKLSESLAARIPPRTLRDMRLPRVPNKALAVIGVRRGGKTSFLERHLTDRLAAGDPPGTHLLVSLEDERLVGATAEDLGWLLEEHRRVVPSVRATGRRTIYLDEIQVVPCWELLVRRILDAHDTEVFISGSSAKLLSQEVNASLRGRAMEVLVHPFSFRERLRHAGQEPTEPWARMGPDERAGIDAALRSYLTIGGFREAQGIDARDRLPLLKGYVDVMLLRDVIERNRVTNVEALRRLQRHLMANPAGPFAVSKFHRDLKSQGFAVAEETLHLLLQHLEDASWFGWWECIRHPSGSGCGIPGGSTRSTPA